VSRGPQRICTDPRAGWEVIEVLGTRSSAPAAVTGGEAAKEDVKAEGKMVGRRRVMDVNVLEDC